MFLSDCFFGVAEYEVQTENTVKFLNSVRKYVSVKKLKIVDEHRIRFTTLYRERKHAEEKIILSDGNIVDKKYKGIPMLLKRLLKRPGLLSGALLSVMFVVVSSMFVWEIRVEGNENLSQERVVEMLEKAGFHEGILKRSVDVKKVTDRLLINEDEVSWMAINFDGNVAHVEMKESRQAVPYEKKENVNLVASANGIVIRVDALEGGTKVSKGEAVIKGQLLVSAFVDKRTGGSLLRGARGYVWANTEREFRIEVPLEYSIKKYTGKTNNSYCFTFLGNTLDFSNPFVSFCEKTEFERHDEKLTLSEKITLPVLVSKISRREYTQYAVRRTKKEAEILAKNTAKQRLYEISPDFVTLNVKEESVFENDKLVFKCCYYGIENIAEQLEFELS